MQLKVSAITIASACMLLQGCEVSTQAPLKAEDVRICDDTETVIAEVKRISADQNLSFHYGTHLTDYGTQATFRLIGRGYEIVLFNSMSQSDYTLRVYKVRSSERTDLGAERAFNRFKEMLVEATSSDC